MIRLAEPGGVSGGVQVIGAASHRFISNAFCEEIPDVSGQHLYLTEFELSGLRDRVSDPLAVITAKLPESLRLEIPHIIRSANA